MCMSEMNFKKYELAAFFEMQSQIKNGNIPKDSLCVIHSEGTANISKGKYSSWTEYWKDNIPDPIVPYENICPCCRRIIVENDSNYFVIGHVEDSLSHEKYLLPLCNECNVKMNEWKFLAKKDRLHPIPTDL